MTFPLPQSNPPTLTPDQLRVAAAANALALAGCLATASVLADFLRRNMGVKP